MRYAVPMDDDDEIPQHSERIGSITLQGRFSNAQAVVQERDIAISDLLEQNRFAPHCIEAAGPYDVALSIADRQLRLTITSERMEETRVVNLPVSSFRSVVRDYFAIVSSYQQAVQAGSAHKIETIDMARRGLHNNGADIVKNQLAGRIDLDFDTARRLFTLICVLHTRQPELGR